MPSNLKIDLITVTHTTNGQSNGEAIVSTSQTGVGTLEYKADSGPWQTNYILTGLSVGLHTAYVRFANDNNSVVSKSFIVGVDDMVITITSTDPTAGLSNGEVSLSIAGTNAPYGTSVVEVNKSFGGYTLGKFVYSGLATGSYYVRVLDSLNNNRIELITLEGADPVTPLPNEYYAVGGVLPNPIPYELNLGADTGGNPKQQHHITVNVFQDANPTAIGNMRQRVSNGIATFDVSAFLKKLNRSIYNLPAIIQKDATAMYPFHITYAESYNGTVLPTATVNNPPRYAVQAARQEYSGRMENNVLFPNQEGLKYFITEFSQPFKFFNHGLYLSVIIDATMESRELYFERAYYDANGGLLEVKSTQIPTSYYGHYLRLQIPDEALPCADYCEAVITDVYRQISGTCPDGSASPNTGTFDETFDFSFE